MNTDIIIAKMTNFITGSNNMAGLDTRTTNELEYMLKRNEEFQNDFMTLHKAGNSFAHNPQVLGAYKHSRGVVGAIEKELNKRNGIEESNDFWDSLGL